MSLRAKAKVEKETVPSATLQSTGEEWPQYHLLSLMFYQCFCISPHSSFLMSDVNHSSASLTLPLLLVSTDLKTVKPRRGSKIGWNCLPEASYLIDITISIFFPYSRFYPRLIFECSPCHDSKFQCQLPFNYISFFPKPLPSIHYHLATTVAYHTSHFMSGDKSSRHHLPALINTETKNLPSSTACSSQPPCDA